MIFGANTLEHAITNPPFKYNRFNRLKPVACGTEWSIKQRHDYANF